MPEPLGLSVGSTNLVAARVGAAPVTRRSVLTVFDDRAPEVGRFPGPNQPGLVLAGFVERVGDPVPLVAADGSSHRGEVVLAEALDAVAREAGGGAPVTVAVPAHWGPAVVDSLRNALRAKPGLSPGGVPPTLIPDAQAALAGLRVTPGLPASGVVVLCDVGGGGTSITLADAGAGLSIIGSTIRYPDFSGDLVDQALLNHVVTGIAEANSPDPASTAAVGSLTRLRDECRGAKERLSADTATVVRAELPGYSSDVRITRQELERLIDAPLAGLQSVIADALQRYRIPAASVSAVATVGGGAAIPLVTQRTLRTTACAGRHESAAGPGERGGGSRRRGERPVGPRVLRRCPDGHGAHRLGAGCRRPDRHGTDDGVGCRSSARGTTERRLIRCAGLVPGRRRPDRRAPALCGW